MKDKDFEDIGKRLHDLEADPPKDGWKRIAPAIKTPAPGGKVVWLRRNWWKPLILLLPLTYYLAVHKTSGSKMKMTSALSRDTVLIGQEPATRATFENPATENNSATTTPAENEPVQSEVSARNTTKDNSNGHTSSTGKEVSKHTAGISDAEVRHEGAEANPVSHDADVEQGSEVILPSKIGSPADDEPTLSSKENSNLASGQNDPEEIRVRTNPVVVSIDSIASMDSLVAVIEPADSAITMKPEEKPEEKSDLNGWRITFAATPQIVNRSVKPIVNDEVLVTSIEDKRKSFSEKLGFGFSLGAGKSLTRNLYLDAQLSYVRTGQNIFYTYATGEVDTMLAIAQPDETVRLTPVYRTLSKETSARFSHAAIRLAGTYYFWTKGRRRYNATVALSANYLVASEVKERTQYVWTEYNNSALNKLNYTFSVGGGYNIFLGKDWELMISPVVLYNLRQIRTNALPYHLKQQSAGLNIMLSKYLRTTQ